MIFDVIFRILEASGCRLASALVAGRVPWSLDKCLGHWVTMSFSNVRSFSKIDFPNSFTVGLSLNLDIWFITCYFVV